MILFVTDIDETLSVGESVSGEVCAACARLREAGWDIMIATGRTFGTAKSHMKAAGATQPAILYDGCRTMSAEGEEIRSSLLDPGLASEILKYLWSLPLEIQITGDEIIHCRESDRETARFYRDAGVPVHYVAEPFTEGPVYRIGLWVPPGELPAVEARLKEAFDGVEVTAGGAEFLGIVPRGVSKGAALERFIEGLPERPEVVLAAGDHKNDLAMLRYADIAAVPRSASGDLFSVADVVMPSASENGVSALVDYMLSPDFGRKTDGPLLLFR